MNFICLVAAWSSVFLVTWSILAAIRDAAKMTRKLHQIPCSTCQFYTDSYYLKCPVHPSKALTEDAIHCPDYFAQRNSYGNG